MPTRPMLTRPRPEGRATTRAGAALLLVLAAAACTVAPGVTVFVLPARDVRRPPPPGGFNAEDRYQRGHYLEVQHYLEALPPAELEKSAAKLSLYGRVLLARGDFEAAWHVLERARSLETKPSRRAEIEWALSQGAILWNDFASAHDYAADAVRDGYGLVPGFLNFLTAMRDTDPYAGPAVGEAHEAAFEVHKFNLIRVPVRVNDLDAAAVVDSGAVYTIVSESFARQARVREIPNSKASGRGLHKKEFPVTFGVIDRLDFAGFSVRDVPVMLMPDEALLFETTRGPFPVPMVLGLHLLKEFTAEIDYRGRSIRFTREDFRVAKRSPDQNLFFHGGRLFVRGSIDRNGFYQFLLDTGSEPTLMTSAGLLRASLPPSNKVSPRRVYGLGKTMVEWGRIGQITIGVAGYGARFTDMVVKDDDSAFEDGIIGASLLDNFRARIDFGRMVLTLEKGR